jgi:hypothetical protein
MITLKEIDSALKKPVERGGNLIPTTRLGFKASLFYLGYLV